MMILANTMQGTMHRQWGMPNQDAYTAQDCNGYTIAVVCDGVSLKPDHTMSDSQIASDWCARFSLEYLKKTLKPDMDEDTVTRTLVDSFTQCERSLQRYLRDQKIPYYDCQTTLLVMALKNGVLYAGMAGDGGCLVHYQDGKIGLLVTSVKTSSVVNPICNTDDWVFGMTGDQENPVTGFLLATDGIFDHLVYLEDGGLRMDSALCAKFFNLACLPKSIRENALDELMEQVPTHDDKTIVVCVNEEKTGCPVIPESDE